MHNYTGNPTITLVDPPTFSLISDGDQLDSAHLNSSHQQEEDYIAAFVRFGAKLNANNTFLGYCQFLGGVLLGSEIDYQQPRFLTASLTQTIRADLSDRWVVPKGTLPGSPVTVTIQESGTPTPNIGCRVRVCFQELNTGANVWRFHSGGGAQLLTIDNTSFTPDLYTNVEFYLGGDSHWHVLEASGMVVSIP